MFVSGVQFGLFNPEEIEKTSVVHVTETSIYQKNLPKYGGVADHRMGTIDRRFRCGTCREDVEGCNGHFGHIVLPIPCYSVFFLNHTLKILRSICFYCSRLLIKSFSIDPDTGRKRKNPKIAIVVKKFSGLLRFRAMCKLVKSKSECPWCGGRQPSYNKEINQKTFGISLDWPDATHWDPVPVEEMPDDTARLIENKQREDEKNMAMKPFTSIDAYNILKHMDPEDVKLFGFDPLKMHPKNLMITVLFVPPPVIRPSVVASEGSKSRGQNDLTRKLLEIVKQCHTLEGYLRENPKLFDNPTREVQYAVTELQYHVVTYMSNPVRRLKVAAVRSGAAIKGLLQRIKGKGGRVRGNLTGKRVDFSSRTVVSPDPNLDIDEVGVPLRIATILTIEERVAPYNIESLQKRVTVGAKKLEGAHTVITDTGRMLYLEFMKPHDRLRIRLQYGWIVERYLKNGDYVLFNRQPSLHKKSLMGHRVRIMFEGDTFRLNLSAAQPYNADFGMTFYCLHKMLVFYLANTHFVFVNAFKQDGDEMVSK